MALATQCPHCHTTFRVASDQLKLRGGIVRCGACQRIFDGNAHLIDLEALAAAKRAGEAEVAASAPAPLPAPAAATEAAPQAPVPDTPEPEPETPATEAPADFEAQPVYTLDFDHTFDPFGILPKADADAQARIEPRLDAAPDEAAAAADAAPSDAPAVETDATSDADVDADAPAAEAAPQAQAAPEPEPEPEPAPESAPEYAPEPKPLAPAPAYVYAPAGRIEPSFDLPVDEALVAQPLHGHEPELEPEPEPAPDAAAQRETDAAPEPAPPPAAQATADALPGSAAASDGEPDPAAADATFTAALPLRASSDLDAPLPVTDAAYDAQAPRSARAKAVEARARRSKLTPTRIEAPRLRVPTGAETDEPEFVKRSRRQERSGKTVRILLASGAAVLLLLLAAQLLLAFRSELALRQPAARPLLNGLCAVAGCQVGLPTRAENLAIDDGELAPIGTDAYSLNTTLRNQGSLVQAWPSIELELTDANNKPLLRRVFGPADYLPAGPAAANGFAAHSEQPVRLNFALADLKPSGYHMFVFYP